MHATFADPLSDAICGHKDIAVGLDDTVAVIGAGPVGTAHAAIARLEGAGQVLLLETAAARLDLAREILGDERMAYVDTSSTDGLAAVRAATEEIGADVVIVACSSDAAQEEAMEMAAPRGRVLFFGGLPKGTTHINFPSNVLHYREVQVHGSYASRHRDQVHALDMLADDIGGLRCVVSRRRRPRQRPGRLRPHPRRRGAEGRRGALSRRIPAMTTLAAARCATRSPRGCATGWWRASSGPATASPASRSWPAAWACRAARCGRRSRCSRRTGLVRRLHGSGTYVTDRPLLRNDLSRNFGVSSHDRGDGARAGHRRRDVCRRGGLARGRRGARRRGRAPTSVLRRVRTAGGRRVVDETDWCRTDLLSPPAMAAAAQGSVYAALAERGADRAPRRRARSRPTSPWATSPGGWPCPGARCS